MCLVVAAVVLLTLAAGCTPKALRDTSTVAAICRGVEVGGGQIVLAWETDAEGRIVDQALASGDQTAAQKALAEQRGKLAKVESGLSGVGVVCASLDATAQISRDAGAAVSVLPELARAVSAFVDGLKDAGVTVPSWLSAAADALRRLSGG